MERFWLASRLRDDAKWLALKAEEKVAVIEAMCWTADHEEDGFVPLEILGEHAPRLIETGWMREVPGGLCFPKWKLHQISRSKLNAKRKAAKDRMKRARSVRANLPRTSREVRSTEERRGEERSTPLAPRKRDALFEAVAEACGIDWKADLTDSARGSMNKAVAQLRGVGATPEETRRRAANWAYPAKLTPAGLAKQWPSLALGTVDVPAGWTEVGS